MQFGLVSLCPRRDASCPAGKSLMCCLRVTVWSCSRVCKFTESPAGSCLSGRRNGTRNALRSFAGKLKGMITCSLEFSAVDIQNI
jgi:hypothetical protein